MLEPLEDYVQFLTIEKGRSRATIEAYHRDCSDFTRWLNLHSLNIQSVSSEIVERYIAEKRMVKAPASVQRLTAALRGWIGFLTDEGLLSPGAIAGVRPGKRPRSLPKPLPEATIIELLESIGDTNPIERRDRALLELLYGTGCRVSEVVTLSIEDIDFDEDLIRLTGKGSKQRLVPIGRSMRDALRTYVGPGGRGEFPRHRPTARVFLNMHGGPLTRQGIDLIIAKRALEVGIDRSTISAHVFRHSCATHMLAHGADIRVVQELLGHVSIATTQVYTAVSVSSLQQAYLSAHPRAVE